MGPGCETGPVKPKIDDPHIIYGVCKGEFYRMSLVTGQEQSNWVYPQNRYGHASRDIKYRFQRVSPIEVSPHDPDVVYHASQYLHRTRDEGRTWERISPDLTWNPPERQQTPSGEPITLDVTGEEFYSTLYAIEESPLEAGVIWTGSNDGLFHVTRDNGRTWTNITPRDLPADAVLAPVARLGPGARLRPPGRDFLLGTDNVSRDIASRIVYGARVTVTVSFAEGGVLTELGRLADRTRDPAADHPKVGGPAGQAVPARAGAQDAFVGQILDLLLFLQQSTELARLPATGLGLTVLAGRIWLLVGGLAGKSGKLNAEAADDLQTRATLWHLTRSKETRWSGFSGANKDRKGPPFTGV